MEHKQYDALLSTTKRALRSKKPYYWWFCLKGNDGQPVLIISKKYEQSKAGGKLVWKSLKKPSKRAMGRVMIDKGVLHFSLDEGNAKLSQVKRTFKLGLAKDKNLKKIKALIQKAVLLETVAWDEVFGDAAEQAEAHDKQEQIERQEQGIPDVLYREEATEAREAAKAARDRALALRQAQGRASGKEFTD